MGVINSILSSGLTIFFIGIIGVVFAYFSLLYRRKANIALTDIQYEIEAIESIQVEGRIPVNSLGEFVKISDNCKIFRRLLMEYRDEFYTTQDATSTIEELWTPDILKSRIVPVVSTILTGLGVLGTFIGLSFGLKGLQLGGNMEHLQDQIQRVADGASIAFMTSICGVSLSLIFTYIEKRKSEQIINTIKKLNILLSSLFPPLPIMQVLVDTHEETKKSTDIQGRLAEQIGSKLQTVFDSFKDNLIQNIANNISSSSEQIKRCLVGESEQSVSENLQSAVETGCSNLQNTIIRAAKHLIGVVNTSRDSIRDSIDTNSTNIQGTFEKCSKSIITEISGSISSTGQQITSLIGSNATDLQGMLNECSGSIISGISETISETGQQISNTISTNSESAKTDIVSELKGIIPIIENNSTGLQGTVNGLSTNISTEIERLIQTITSSSDDIKQGVASELKNIPSEVRTGVGEMINEHLVPAITKLSEVSGEIKEMPENIKERLGTIIDKKLSPAIEGLKEAAKKFVEGKSDSSVAALRELVTEFTKSMGTEGKSQRTSLEETRKQFESSIANFTQSMTSLIKEINKKQDDRGDELEKTVKDTLGSLTEQIKSTESLLKQINICREAFGELSIAIKESSVSLEESSGHLQVSSANLQRFGSNISESMNRGATSVERAVQIVSDIEARQEEANKRLDTVMGRMDDVAGKLETVRASLDSVGQSLSGSAQQVTEGFEKAKKGFIELADHYTKFQQGLAAHMATMDEETQKQVEALDDHMTKLLDNYTQNVNKQVTKLMTSWNDLTKDFCTNMTNVVAVMESLVNSLDLKRKQGETTA